MDDVFCEKDSLEFDEEEVGQLFKILEDGLDGLFGDSVVLAGPERTCQALGQKDSSRDFNGSHY
jgi:hypothetical protein